MKALEQIIYPLLFSSLATMSIVAFADYQNILEHPEEAIMDCVTAGVIFGCMSYTLGYGVGLTSRHIPKYFCSNAAVNMIAPLTLLMCAGSAFYNTVSERTNSQHLCICIATISSAITAVAYANARS